MKSSSAYKIKFKQAKRNHQQHHIIGIPKEINFRIRTARNLELLKSSFLIPDAIGMKFTEIIARTETSRGTILSELLVASQVNAQGCSLFIHNSNCKAILEYEYVYLYNSARELTNPKREKEKFVDPLNHFHRWLEFEIAKKLKRTRYFSKLHDGADIQSLVLERLPKVWHDLI